MNNYLYFLLNATTISVPFLFSFYRKTEFWTTWKRLLPALLIMDSIYIIWDIIFTHLGVWGFNDNYITGYHILNLPMEEWLFFICIPYASLFIHYSMLKIFPSWRFSIRNTKIIFYLIILTLSVLIFINLGKLYTNCCFLITITILSWVLIKRIELLQTFFLSYIFILIPFFIINGILTGTFIIDQVVWYNNHHNIGIRLGTIPFEDIFYGFTLLLGTIFISDTKLITKS